MGEMGRGLMLGVSGVLALAIIAVLVSQKAQTSGVVTSAFGGLATVINAAVSPVTGTTTGSAASSVLSNLGLTNSTGNDLTLDGLGLSGLNTYQTV